VSRAAEDYVETLPFKGSALELLRTIAKRIPEGQTTTPPSTTDELAAPAKQSEKTVRRNRDALIRDRVISVHDGGRGNVARYEILNLAGKRPPTPAPLPLLGRPKPPRTKEQRKTLVTLTNLFDETLVKVTNDRDNWWARIVNVGQTLVKVTNDRAYALGQNVRRLIPPWLRLVRARDVHTFKNVHTPAAPREGPTDDEMRAWPPDKIMTPEETVAYDAWLARDRRPAFADPPPPRIVHPWHAWSPPAGTRGVCVPKYVHDNWLRKGYEPEWLFAFYARTCATLSAEDVRRAVDEIKFWRVALAAELAIVAPKARAPTRGRPDIPNTRPCPHQPPCEGDGAACIDRQMAEWQAAKTGSG
jgi:hypothetical protein